MKFRMLAATATFTAALTGLTAGIAHARPVTIQPARSDAAAHGIDHDLPFATSLNPVDSSVTTTVDTGRFAPSDDGKTVSLLDATGTRIDSLPLAVTFAGATYPLTPLITDAGHSLTLTPVGAPLLTPEQRPQAELQFVDAAADLNRHQYNAGVGALIGLGIGILLGLPFGVIGAIPGGVIGAAVGALIGWVLP
ncbi:hypothetical protein [Nocardia heshunensis]